MECELASNLEIFTLKSKVHFVIKLLLVKE